MTTADVDSVMTSTHETAHTSTLGALVVLFKLRVVMLLVLAAVGGAMLGSGGAPTFGDLVLLLITGTTSAAGASALNQFIERGSDGSMKRTRRRPLVTGQFKAGWVLAAGIGLVIFASALALIVGNVALAIWLAVGAWIYVGVYTIWLKPRSVLNVVIGGAAGSAAVLSGGAAVGQWSDSGVILLALLLFTWSPMHFWSLALAYRADYARAGVPMLPVVSSPRRALFWMLAHVVATAGFGLALATHDALGWFYLVPVALGTIWLLRESMRLIADYSGPRAMTVFKVSNLYLSLVLTAICVVTLVS